VEVIPDASLLRGTLQVFPRRRRIQELERIILDNPSAGNYEELGLLYLDDGNFARARACYDKAINSRTDHADPFYRRGIAEVELGDFAAAVPDFERAVLSDPDYDFHRAKGLLAWAYAQTGQTEKADTMFREATRISTISETYYHYALFLQSQGRAAEARVWSQKILDKKPTMPGYLRRRERPWVRKASSLLGRLPAA
jgi:tetratricopeptide (TPR) repeat protein